MFLKTLKVRIICKTENSRNMQSKKISEEEVIYFLYM